MCPLILHFLLDVQYLSQIPSVFSQKFLIFLFGMFVTVIHNSAIIDTNIFGKCEKENVDKT